MADVNDFLYSIYSTAHLAEPEHINIDEAGVDNGFIFTSWPFEELQSISSIIAERGLLSPDVALSICKALAVSLNRVHQATGINHLNLTPNCIYINSQGYVRFNNFGTAGF